MEGVGEGEMGGSKDREGTVKEVMATVDWEEEVREDSEEGRAMGVKDEVARAGQRVLGDGGPSVAWECWGNGAGGVGVGASGVSGKIAGETCLGGPSGDAEGDPLGDDDSLLTAAEEAPGRLLHGPSPTGPLNLPS